MFKSLWNFFWRTKNSHANRKKIRLELINKIECVKVKIKRIRRTFFPLVFGLFCSVWHLFQNRSVFHCCCYCLVCVFFSFSDSDFCDSVFQCMRAYFVRRALKIYIAKFKPYAWKFQYNKRILLMAFEKMHSSTAMRQIGIYPYVQFIFYRI